MLANLAPEMSGQNYHRHARSVSGGAEEFIEAATFLRYLATGQIPTFTEMGAVFREATGYPLQPTDYLAGIGDLTGELMRLCLNAAARGDVPTASSACDAVRNVERLFPLAETAAAGTPGGYGVKKKVDEMRNSARKCELACFALRLRGMEKVPGRIFGLDDDNENGLGDEDESRPASAPRPAGRGGGRGRGRGGRGRGGGGGVKRDREQDNEAALMEDVEQS